MAKFLVEFEEPISMVQFPVIFGIDGTCQVDRLGESKFLLTGVGEPEIEGATVKELA